MTRSFFTQHWRRALLILLTVGLLALLWRARDTPLQPVPYIQLDGLSLFFLLASSCFLLLHSLEQPEAPFSRRTLTGAALLAVGYAVTLTPVIALTYALTTIVFVARPRFVLPGSSRLSIGSVFRVLSTIPPILAAVCLLVAYSSLALRGAISYDARTAGAALDSFVFWFALLAAAIPLIPWQPITQQQSHTNDQLLHSLLTGQAVRVEINSILLHIGWLYPLVRLYTLGPWNTGWSLAALLLGGALALWSAVESLRAPYASRRRHLGALAYAGLALAGFGMSTSAGIAAGCYAMLVSLLFAYYPASSYTQEQAAQRSSILVWLLSGAIPVSAPFVASWLLIGAAAAGGSIAVAGIAWLVALINALAVVLYGGRGWPHKALVVRSVASCGLGVAAPLVVLLIIEPVIQQLQGGLTPYGDIVLWPWIGVAVVNSARAQVGVQPAVAVAGLMLVLTAFVYLIARLRDSIVESGSPELAESQAVPRLSEVLAALRDDVPWLSLRTPAKPQPEQPIDSE